MSANVWFEEVNTGLIKELRNTIRVKDADGYSVPLEDKAIILRKPEEDFKSEVFPCVSIYNISSRYARDRHNPMIPVKVGEIPEHNIVILEDPAIPFNLMYQIDFWAKYQTDIDMMTRTWLMKHYRQFSLSVIDDGGTERECNCVTKGSVVKSDLTYGGDRLFHSIIKLQIWVELDEETRYNKPMVVQRGIDTNVKP